MMEIPDEAYSAACVEMDGEIALALHRAWPHLYAAALRHAANRVGGPEGDYDWYVEMLLEAWAAEAISPPCP